MASESVDQVEKILDRRLHPDRGVEYKVRWKGSDGSDDEWFSGEQVEHQLQDLLRSYEETSQKIRKNKIVPMKRSAKEIKKELKKLSRYCAENSLHKNYADAALNYRNYRKYLWTTKLAEDPLITQKCVLCQKRLPAKVFFPCQHASACEYCIKKQNIGVGSMSKPDVWGACPLCMDEIRWVGDLRQSVEEEYWEWLHKSKPPLPWIDRHEFSQIARKLEGGNGADNQQACSREDRFLGKSCCGIS